MKATVIEISGYVPAIMALYMTNKNCTPERIKDIQDSVWSTVDKAGFIYPNNNLDSKFTDYMTKLMSAGVKKEHETLLDFIKISVYFEGIHRGAQDDYDAHAKRMDIIRSSTRINHKPNREPEISEWYQDKIIPFWMLNDIDSIQLPDRIEASNSSYIKTSWGYVKEEYSNNPDVLRGLVGLAFSHSNISTMSFRNWRHVYDLRRKGTKAAPELQSGVEMVRQDLYNKMPILGNLLGKVWVVSGGGHFEEKIDTAVVSLNDVIDNKINL